MFDQIVEVFDVPSFTVFRDISFCLELVERFGIGRIFVNVDHTRFANMRRNERFEKETFGSFSISRRFPGEQERVSYLRAILRHLSAACLLGFG